MKKSIVMAVCATLLAGAIAWGSGGPVYSQNGVGYQTFDLVGGKWYCLRCDFEKMNGTAWGIGELFGNGLAPFSTVYVLSGGVWSSENWDGSSFDPGVMQITRGDAMLIEAGGAATNRITFSGEIPGKNNGATNAVVALGQGFNTAAYSYPQSRAITNLTLGAAAGGEPMSLYYLENGAWGSINWDGSSWDPDSFVLTPGQGTLIDKGSAGTTNWVEQIPYTWP